MKKKKGYLGINLSEEQRARAAEYMQMLDRKNIAIEMLKREKNMMKAVRGYKPMTNKILYE